MGEQSFIMFQHLESLRTLRNKQKNNRQKFGVLPAFVWKLFKESAQISKNTMMHILGNPSANHRSSLTHVGATTQCPMVGGAQGETDGWGLEMLHSPTGEELRKGSIAPSYPTVGLSTSSFATEQCSALPSGLTDTSCNAQRVSSGSRNLCFPSLCSHQPGQPVVPATTPQSGSHRHNKPAVIPSRAVAELPPALWGQTMSPDMLPLLPNLQVIKKALAEVLSPVQSINFAINFNRVRILP